MDRLPLDRIVSTNRGMQRYHLRLEMPPTLIADCDVDLSEGLQHWQLGLLGVPYPLSVVFWDHGTSLARLASGAWARVAGEPLGHELGRLAELLTDREPVHVHEGEMDWVIEYHPDRLPLAEVLGAHFAERYGPDTDEHLRQTAARAIDAARSLIAVMLLHIERRSLRIHAVDL